MPQPQTRVRLKGYVSLQTLAGGLFLDPTGNIAQQIADAQKTKGGLVTVGSAGRLEVNQIREENSYYRQFITDPAHPENAAKPAETFPGLIRYELTLRRVDLYDANMFEAFKVLPGQNIVDQYKALVLFVTQFAPGVRLANSPTGDPGKTLENRTYIIPGVWLNSIPMMWDIEDTNQSFVQEVSGIALDVITPS